MCFENPSDRRSTHAMPNILEGALDSGVAPRRILLRHPDDEPADLRQDAATSRTCSVRPFPRDELPMPAQNRLRRDDRGNLTQATAA
jgi:hypothetical protein